MKKQTFYLRTVIVLMALFCVSSVALAQGFGMPADFSEGGNSNTQPTVLKVAPSFGMNLRVGDVNGDGLVAIGDVTALIDMLLQRETVPSGDVNADGMVSIGDVTTLIDLILRGDNVYDTTAAQNALNEIYTSMHTAGWSTAGNTHQTFGISAYNLMAEVMGDDMIMGALGSGWFWFDANYSVKQRYTSNSWRSYDLWNAYYTWIANANYILAACQSMGSATGSNYVKGQAYAIRAYSYFMLAQTFARTYKGHESDPCVPIFEGTTFNGSTGQLRSTVAEVYAQIDSDIRQAVNLLQGTTQQSPSHISYAVALGLRSRIYLVEENWNSAYIAARDAIQAAEAQGKGILEVSDFNGVNDANKGNVMWAGVIPTAEVGMYASFWAHMLTYKAYGQRAPKQISKWLYNKMSNTDTRRAWWKTNDTGYGSDALVQNKFDVVEGTEWDGDYIWMRVEEMYLNAAEALAHRGGMDTNARNLLNQLMAKRDPNYSCTKSGNSLGELTNDETGSLLEEILIQRRIELWGEDGRIYTIRRLHQGFERPIDYGWPAALELSNRTLNDPETYPWVITIPQAEYYNYYSRMILAADQNPLGDTYEQPTDVERTPQHLSFTKAEYNVNLGAAQSIDLDITLTRPNTSSKRYDALLCLKDDESGSERWFYVTFNPNRTQSILSIPFSGVDMLMKQYHFTLSLTDLEMSVANSSQMTSTKITVDVRNFGAEGQHISFETANQNVVKYSNGFLEVPVTMTRAITTNAYRAHVTISNQSNPDNISLRGEDIIFNAGESTATATIAFNDMVIGNTYSCVLSLSDADIATANPALGEQITSTTVTVQVKSDEEGWESAGTCTFTDYTWAGEDGVVAMNVPVQKAVNDNLYRIVKPLYYAYNGIESEPSLSNWKFTLNSDGSIQPLEGEWDLEYWGYYGYYNTSSYSSYCYVEQDGNTYDVHFLLRDGGQGLYSGGHFQFIWNR